MLLHASCVAINGKAVLLTGISGVGKSDLAIRLIDDGAQLVADDQTLLSIENGVLLASPPPTIEGMIEIRHAGLARLPFVAGVPVALLVDLTPSGQVLERMPEQNVIFFLDQPVQRLRLPAFAASTPAKIRLLLSHPGINDGTTNKLH